MKKLILAFYFLLSTFYLYSQEQFNVVYPNEYFSNPKTVFILQDTGYATVGGASINNWGIAITFADINGNYLGSKFYSKAGWDLYHGVENNCFKIGDKYYLSGNAAHPTGDIHNPIDSAFIYIYIYNEYFDSLKIYTFQHDTVYAEVRSMIPTIDNGFLIVGNARRRDNGSLVYTNSYDAFMLKVDSLGQEEWYKTFGRNTSGNDEDEFYKVVQTPDNGYLCVGYTKSWQTAPTVWDRGDWWLVKTDSLGNEQWSRRYGHPDYDDGRPYSAFMASDTSYYIVGAEVKYQDGSNNFTQSHILKLDQNFNEAYEKDFGEPLMKNCFFSIIENDENDLLLTGYIQPGDEIDLYSERAILLKINADGDSIWKRQYTCTDTLWSGIVNRAYSIKQTADGGYIFTGIAYDNDLSPAQQVWLVKTDEYGCDGTDWWTCATNVMVNALVNNPSFEMYPNPARESLTLTLSKGEGKQNTTVEIYNLTGELVTQVQIQNSSQKVQINDLKSGVYFVKVGEQMQKLVVE